MPRPKGQAPESYEPDLDAVELKARMALELLTQAAKLLDESASGGKWETGWHIDGVPEEVHKAFDMAQADLTKVTSSTKRLIRRLTLLLKD